MITMKGGLKKILYVCAVVVLFVLGFWVWKMNVWVGESKSFRVDGVQSAEFVFETKVENPRVLTLTFDGELDCDAVVVIKGKGRGGDALMRRTFPLKQEKVEDERFETPWEDPRVEIQFRTNGCVARDFEINVEVAE